MVFLWIVVFLNSFFFCSLFYYLGWFSFSNFLSFGLILFFSNVFFFLQCFFCCGWFYVPISLLYSIMDIFFIVFVFPHGYKNYSSTVKTYSIFIESSVVCDNSPNQSSDRNWFTTFRSTLDKNYIQGERGVWIANIRASSHLASQVERSSAKLLLFLGER